MGNRGNVLDSGFGREQSRKIVLDGAWVYKGVYIYTMFFFSMMCDPRYDTERFLLWSRFLAELMAMSPLKNMHV